MGILWYLPFNTAMGEGGTEEPRKSLTGDVATISSVELLY